MPRGKNRKTKSGEKAQAPQAIEGQGYGDGVAGEQLQQAMPMVDRRASGVPSASPAAAPTTPAGGPGPQQAPDLAAMLGQAPLGLLAGSQNPQQAVTAGLSTGPGPGPNALSNLRAQTPLRRTLTRLADATGDRQFRDLIERAGL